MCRREQREKEKAERGLVKAGKAKEVAERKTQRECDKQGRDAEKAVQLPQRGKRKAPPFAAPRKKQNCGAVAARRGVVAATPPSTSHPQDPQRQNSNSLQLVCMREYSRIGL